MRAAFLLLGCGLVSFAAGGQSTFYFVDVGHGNAAFVVWPGIPHPMSTASIANGRGYATG